MDRFHHSMSWNHPTDQGPNAASGATNPEQTANEGPTSSVYTGQQINTGQPADDCFDAESWSRPTSHRSFFLPLHYTPSYDYPLIVWLHSNGFNENQIDDVMPYISLRNYVGVGVRATNAADAVGHRFDWHHSAAAIGAAHDTVSEALHEASHRFSINSSRIVLAGYGYGGTMALRIAMRQPDQIAGAISLGGRLPQGAIRNIAQLRERRLPMLWQWGAGRHDFNADNLKSDCRSALALGTQVEIRQYPGDDEMDTVVLRDIDDWIMQRIVSGASSSGTTDRWASSPTAYSMN